MSYESPYLRLDYGSTGTDLLWLSGNVTAVDYYTRTSIFDKSRGSALDFIQDTDYYKIDNQIQHNKFYGYTSLTYPDKSKPVIEEYPCLVFNEETEKEEQGVCEKTSYPFNKTDEFVSLNGPLQELEGSNELFTFRTPDNYEELQRVIAKDADALSDQNIKETIVRTTVFNRDFSNIARILSHEAIHQTHTLNNFNGFADGLWNFLGSNPHPTLTKEEAYNNIYSHAEEVLTVMQNEGVMEKMFDSDLINEAEYSRISDFQNRLKIEQLQNLENLRQGFGDTKRNELQKIIINYWDSY